MRTCLKKFAMVLVCAAAMTCMCIFNGNALFGGYADVTLGSLDGDVTQPSQDADGTYLIGTAEELAWFASYVNAGNGSINGRLTADIVLNDCDVNAAVEAGSTDGLVQWTPIGNNSNKFNGKFDGAGHTVSGIYINTTSNYQGLFGYTDSGSSIANVGVVNSYIKGGAYAGGICGRNNGSISNSYNTGEVSSNGSSAYAGGICGYNIGGSIENSCNTGAVSSSSSCAAFAGGICGYNADNGDNYKGSIANSCNTGEVSSSSSANGYSAYAGGICGDNYKGSIANSCNTGAVSSSSNGSSAYAGGICGWNSSGSIENSYNTGEVSSSSAYFVAYAGGICGENRNGGSIENSYNTGAFSSSNGSSVYAGGICGWNYGSNSSISNCMYLPQSGISGIGIDSGTTTNVTEFSSDDNKAKIEEALNAWVNSEDNNPGGTYESWAIVPNYNDGYPVLVPQTETVTKSDGTTAEYYLLYNPADMYWFSNEVNSGNNSINARLGIDIVLNPGYTFEFDEASGLVKVTDKDGTVQCALGIGVKGKTYNTSTAGEIGTIYSADALTSDSLTSGTLPTGIVGWTPIGDNGGFIGTFDGQGHTISGIYINSTSIHQGLFKCVNGGGSISNVGVVNSYIKGRFIVGGICGYNGGGSISNSYNTGAVSSSSSDCNGYVGGICGMNYGGSIENSYNTGAVSSVSSCSSASTFAGGICGYNDGGSTSNSYNTGAVSSSSYNAYAGGICGGNRGIISNSYNTGEIGASGRAGGICGKNNGGSISNSFSSGDLPCTGNGNFDGTAKITTAEQLLNDLNTWVDANNSNSEYYYWISDLENENEGYPLLSSQMSAVKITYVVDGETIERSYVLGDMPSYEAQGYADENKLYNFTGWDKQFATVTEETTYTAQYDEISAPESIPAEDFEDNVTYLIDTPDKLKWAALYVNAGNPEIDIKLTGDILINDGTVYDANGELKQNLEKWTPIGTKDNPFKGNFNGEGYTISGIYIDTTEDYQGLFGCIGDWAYVYNVGVVNSYIKGGDYVGGICGHFYGFSINNCYNAATVIGNNRVGGISGNAGSIRNSYNIGSVSGNEWVGGICGYGGLVSIENAYNMGTVEGQSKVGGICGENYSGTINNSYNTMDVSGTDNVGGICGYMDNYGGISGSYNSGEITGNSAAGGILGYLGINAGDISDCQYLSDTAADAVGVNEKGAQDATKFTADNAPALLKATPIDKGELQNALNSWVDGEISLNSTDLCYWNLDEDNVNDGYPVFDNRQFTITWKMYLGETVEEQYAYGYMPSFEANNCFGSMYYVQVFTGWDKEIARVTEEATYTAQYDDLAAPQLDTDGTTYLIGTADELRWFALCVDLGRGDISGKLTANIDLNPGYKFEFDEASGLVKVSFNGEDVCALGMGIKGKTYNTSTAGEIGTIYSVAALTSDSLTTATLPTEIVSWMPIGKYLPAPEEPKDAPPDYEIDFDSYAEAFKGTFDGDNYTISGIYINITEDYQGLFGYAKDASISNVGVINSYIYGRWDVGGICGFADTTQINNSYNAGLIIGESDIGGICGGLSEFGGSINNSYNIGRVCGGNRVGGIVGLSNGDTVNSYNTGMVIGKNDWGCTVGGICGDNGYGKVINCYNTGIVSAYSVSEYSSCNVGGICGRNSVSGGISNSYNIGEISGTGNGECNVGSICGTNGNIIEESMYLEQSGIESVGKSESYGMGGTVTDTIPFSAETTPHLLDDGSIDKEEFKNVLNSWVDSNSTEDSSYSYWSSDIANTNDGYPVFNTVEFTVTWVSDDGTVLATESYVCGSIPVYPGQTPTKEADEKYTYTFAGWTPEIAAVNGDATYTAVFENELKMQPDENGVYLIHTAEELRWFAKYVNDGKSDENTKAKLMADIDLNPGYKFEFDEESGLVRVSFNGQDVCALGMGLEGKTYHKDTAGMSGEIYSAAALTGDELTNGTIPEDIVIWIPIGKTKDRDESSYSGNDEDYSEMFKGTFDGSNHTVSGIYINSEISDDSSGASSNKGLFGVIRGASISNVGVVNSYISGFCSVGGIVGIPYDEETDGSIINNCYSTGAVTTRGYGVGGICGTTEPEETAKTRIINCYNTGVITGGGCVGGICGAQCSGEVINCYNTGLIADFEGDDGGIGSIGGICGYIQGYCNVISSYNTGMIVSNTGLFGIGGICGGITYGDGSNGSIMYCYNMGTVLSNGNYVAGICGFISNSGGISNCNNVGEVTGNEYVGGISGYIEKSNEEDFCISITNSCSTGNITGNSNVGGICGNNVENGADIIDCKFLTGTADKGVGGEDASEITAVSIDEMPSVIARDGSIDKEELKSELNKWVSDNNSSSIYHYWASDANNINDGYPILSKYTVAYTVEWVDNEKTLKTELYAYGEIPSYKGEIPTRDADGNYTYTFAGWTPQITTVTNDKTYVAKFDAKAKVQIDENGSYLITTPEEFIWFIDEVNSGEDTISLKLEGDIDLKNLDTEGIINEFNGKFDGDGHRVTLNGVPLFSEIGTEGEVRDTSFGGMLDGNGCEYLGAIANINGGKIVNCRVDASLENANNIGGIAGKNTGSIINCLSNAVIKGTETNISCGGICADNLGSVSICVFSGSFDSVPYAKFASIAFTNASGTISDCYYIITAAESLNAPTAIGNRSKNSGAVCYTVKDGVKLTTGMVMSKRIAVLLNSAVDKNGPEELLRWRENTDEDTNIPGELSIFAIGTIPQPEQINNTKNDEKQKGEDLDNPNKNDDNESTRTDVPDLSHEDDNKEEAYASLTYAAHIENYGWLDFVNEGETAGTTDQSLRLEGLKIVVDSNLEGSIEYRTHVEDYDWQDFVCDGAVSGTEGASLRAEAVEIRLTGELAEKYSVKYRAHVQDEGWQDWKYDGGMAGTTGQSLRMEAIEIYLIEKGDYVITEAEPEVEQSEPEYEEEAADAEIEEIYASLTYAAHIEDYGWLDFVGEGETAGTTNQSLRLEGLKIVVDSNLEGSIEYRIHVQDYDWQDFVKDGAVSGTEGASLRAEAVEIRLTGELAEKYSVRYRAHVQDEGWQAWRYDGEMAGTTGLSARMEAIQIQLVDKLDRNAVNDDVNEAVNDAIDEGSDEVSSQADYANLTYAAHIEDYGWLDFVNEGETAGTTDQSLRLEGLKIVVDSNLEGSIEYRTHVEDLDWQDFVCDGEVSGTEGQALRAEAVEIRLTGELAEKYSVKYRAHVQDEGWQDWKYDGEMAGTTGQSLRMEAIEIVLVEK